jgi:hypothetical protein
MRNSSSNLRINVVKHATAHACAALNGYWYTARRRDLAKLLIANIYLLKTAKPASTPVLIDENEMET